MRIWLVPSAFAPHAGGIESVALALAIALQSRGHDVLVVTHRFPTALPASEIIDGIPVRRIIWGAPRSSPTGGARYANALRRAVAELESLGRPDIAHVHGASTQVPPISWFCWRRRVPLVLTSHGETAADAHGLFQQSVYMRACLRLAARQAVHLTTPSVWTRDEASVIAPAFARAQVVHNGIDVQSFLSLPALTDEPVFAAFGRHEKQKGFDLLLEAWREVRSQVPEAQLLLGGAGSETQRLRARADESVEFLGQLSRAGVLELLAATRVVVVPSRVEAFGISALEALAARRVLVHSGIAGLQEATSGLGIIADPRQPDAFAAALVQALRSRPADADVWVRTHDWTRIAMDYEALYQATRP